MDLLKVVCFLSALGLFIAPGATHASINIGALTFDDLAFADLIMSTDFTGELNGCPGTEVPDLESALLGSNLNTWIDYGYHDFFPGMDGDYNSDAPPTQYIEVAFVDNLALNLPGPDVAIFQMGTSNAIRVSLDLDSILNPGAVTSTEVMLIPSYLQVTNDCGWQVSVGYLELDDLGVPRGEGIYRVFLSSPVGVNGEIMGPPSGYPNLGVPELAAVAAFHSDVKSNDAPLVLELDDEGWASLPSASIDVKAVARDDGLPAPGVLTCQWLTSRGPALAVFDDPNAFETVAHFGLAGRYDLSVEVTDGDLTTTRTMAVMVTDVDSEPPTAPTGLTAAAISGSRIDLDWNEAVDNAAVATYEIFRDGVLAGTSPDLSFSDTGLQLLTSYSYHLVAVDLSGNRSISGDALQASTLGHVEEVLIATGADDAEEALNGSVQLGTSDLDLIHDGPAGDQVVGIRFTSVDIPPSVQVLSAWVEFTTHAADSDPTSLVIVAEDIGDAPPFTSVPYNISGRLPTVAQSFWDNVQAWPEEHYFHCTPDLSAIVQELIDRPDWTEGNAMAFLISGSGTRRAKAYESGFLVAPMLHIEYAPPPVNQAPLVDAGFDTTVDLPDAPLQLDATVSDDGLPFETLTISWSQESGPGTAFFNDVAVVDTWVDFNMPGTYILQLQADDGEYQTTDTLTVVVTDLDLEPPSIPQNLQTHVVQGIRVDLSWDASTDNAAVAGYVIHRNGTRYWRTTDTEWSDTVVEGASRHTYTVEAYDPQGNFSGQSDPSTAYLTLRPYQPMVDDR